MSDSSIATAWLQIKNEDDELTRSIITLLDRYGTIPRSLAVSICCNRTSRGGKIAILDTELRACRQDLTITKAALSEAEEVKLPEDLETDYRALMEGDPCNIKPASSATASNIGELDAQQTIKAETKEYQHGKVVCSTHTTDSPPAVPKPVAHAEKCSAITQVSSPEPCIKSVAEGRMNDSNRDTKVSQLSTFKSSTAGEVFVTKDKAAGKKRRSSDRVDDVVKKVKTEQDSTELERPTLDRTLPRVQSEGEGESGNDFVRVKRER